MRWLPASVQSARADGASRDGQHTPSLLPSGTQQANPGRMTCLLPKDRGEGRAAGPAQWQYATRDRDVTSGCGHKETASRKGASGLAKRREDWQGATSDSPLPA